MIRNFLQTLLGKAPNHVIIYSHGFGVQKDDRGLFTDIAKTIPDYHHHMFDYNSINKQTKEVVASPLTSQAQLLNQHIKDIRAQFPNATVDIIGHSQGCAAVALAMPSGIGQTIFLAPPTQLPGRDRKLQLLAQPNTTEGSDGSVRYPRRDGTTTIIGNDYWNSCEGVKPPQLYNQLSDLTDLTIIRALDDEVLGDITFGQLSPNIRYLEVHADHNFTEKNHEVIAQTIIELLASSSATSA